MTRTKQEFISKQQALQTGEKKRVLITILLMFGPWVGVTPFLKNLNDQPWLEPVLPVAFLGWIFLVVVTISLNKKKLTKLSWRLCPHCHQTFNAQIAIASDNCGHCGEKVFSESSPSQL